jgi:hypothetical protein
MPSPYRPDDLPTLKATGRRVRRPSIDQELSTRSARQWPRLAVAWPATDDDASRDPSGIFVAEHE